MPSVLHVEPPESIEAARRKGGHDDPAAPRDELESQPNRIDTLFQSAEAAAKRGDSDNAMQIYRRVIERERNNALAHYKYGNLLKDREQFEAALASYESAVAVDPDFAYAFCNRGFALERLNRWDAALESYDRAIALMPGDALAHYNRAGVLRKMARQDEALASYSQAVALQPNDYQAYCNQGLLLTEMKRLDEALASYAKSLEINSEFGPAYCGRGSVLQLRKDRDAAMASYDRAIELDPGHAVAHLNRGSLLMELQQWNAARSSLDRAIALKPDLAEAYDFLALLLAAMSHSEAALTNFDKAIAFKPDYAEAHLNRANLLVSMKRFLPAIRDYEQGVALKADARFVPGMHRYAKMSVCDWSGLSADLQRLVAGIEAGEMLSPPLPMLALVDSARLHRKAAEIWVREMYSASFELPAIPRRPRMEKPRIGYFSGDFHEHPVAILTVELFETHDRSKFEIYAFSYGPDPRDGMRQRLETAFDRFIDVRGRSDREIALLARDLRIDIAVDLGGHTGLSRTGIFALRAAPLQVSYVGFPGTMGADYMDYMISDANLIPSSHQQFYSEKILYLPSFQANDSKRRIADRLFTREELTLPVDSFVFCCFNANYKITPATFTGWMRILAKVPESVLYLYADNEAAIENLRKEAQKKGIDADRLIFANKLPLADYLARNRVADLFLDTLPYNAGATASDALYAGLPVLTLVGDAFAGRMGASLLSALEIPELITETQEKYEDLAVALATDPQRLAAIKQKLAVNRSTTLLFDTPRFVKHLEIGYSMLLENHRAGLSPEHVSVELR